MTTPAAIMTARWRQISAAVSGSEPTSGPWQAALDELLSAYGGSDRHYHGLTHIAALLDLSRLHAPSLCDPIAVDLAIFYHDAVYEPLRSDNEEKSALLAASRLTALHAAPDLVATVGRHIRATRHGASPPAGDDPDLDVLLDIDLSILAAPPAEYDAYAAAIRREYAAVPDILYRPGRAKVLRMFQAMPAIYRGSTPARDWEQAARANLERELAGLP